MANITTDYIFQILKIRPPREAFMMLHGILIFQKKNLKQTPLESIVWLLTTCINCHHKNVFSKEEVTHLLKLTDACLPNSDILDYLTMFQPNYFIGPEQLIHNYGIDINESRKLISMLPFDEFTEFSEDLLDEQINIRLVKKNTYISNYLSLEKVTNFSPFEEISAFISVVKPTSIILNKSKYDKEPMIILFYTGNPDNPFDYHALPSFKAAGISYIYQKNSDEYKILRISVARQGQVIYDARIEQEKKLLPGGSEYLKAETSFNNKI